MLSKKAREKLQTEIESNLGPIQPHHLREARRVMIEKGEFVAHKPASMFLSK